MPPSRIANSAVRPESFFDNPALLIVVPHPAPVLTDNQFNP
jgi:hypothetical protein